MPRAFLVLGRPARVEVVWARQTRVQPSAQRRVPQRTHIPPRPRSGSHRVGSLLVASTQPPPSRIIRPMRRDLPSGTVTFLFSDVEGSTKLLHELGAERY